VYGALVLLGSGSEAAAWARHSRLLSVLAEYAGVKIRSARLVAEMRETAGLGREMEAARAIQQSLLPRDVIRVPPLDLAASCVPAAFVGGDFYSFIPLGSAPLGPGELAIVAADIAGHGLSAALMMASLRSILRSELKFSRSPAEVLRTANELVVEDVRESGVYATLFLGIYDAETRTLRYSAGGHPAPLWWRAADGCFERLGVGGVPLGMFGAEEYDEATVTLDEADLLIIFTDGVTETRSPSGEQFGEERLAAVVRQHAGELAGRIHDRVRVAVEAHRGRSTQEDDMTIIVLRAR
jgi:sigma-B regulation protein RsbU (phosphoserine phosphatase)